MGSDDRIFITGIAGVFPNLRNVAELSSCIADKKQVFSPVDPYWETVIPGVPPCIGKQRLDDKFDAGFFGVHHKLAESMHQSTRRLLEVSVEALMDAGLNPSALKGSRTGVFVADADIECHREWIWHKISAPNFGIVGSTRSSLAEYISYYLQLQGPSSNIDTGCSSSLYALDCAVQALKSGRCENALVCGVNILQNPHIMHGYQLLNVLNPNGEGNVFEDSCVGYIRSEATTAIFLQKWQDAKRVYAEVLGVKTNSNGFKKTGLTFPSSGGIASVIRDVYEEIGVDPAAIDFVECHITGTVAGFSEEMKAVEDVFCSGRKLPLLVGSVKANVGHAESVSGFVSIFKILLGLQRNCILPNPDFCKIKSGANAIQNGKVEIATERFSLPSDRDSIIGCNNCGFGGTNGHIVLKHHQLQTNQPPRSRRLICFSARTKQSLTKIAASFKDNPTEEYLTLLQNLFGRNVHNHPHRGYAILNNGKLLETSLGYCSEKPQLCLVFPENSETCLPLLGEIEETPALSNTFKKIRDVLQSKDVDVLKLCHQVLGVVLQLAVADVLKSVLKERVLIESYRSGAIPAAYVKEELSLEDALMLTYELDRDLKDGFFKDTWIRCQNEAKVAEQSFLGKDARDQVKVIFGFKEDVGQLSFGPNTTLLQILGRLYTLGFDLDLEALYPHALFPVKAPFISPLLEWNHADDWHFLKYQLRDPHKLVATISLENANWKFLSGHVLDGRNLLPASAFLVIVWDWFLKINHLIRDTKIIFENVRYHRVTVLSKDKPLVLTINMNKLEYKFEVQEGDDCIVTGRIRSASELNFVRNRWSFPKQNQTMNTKDFYKKLNLHGCNYSGAFCCVQEVNLEGTNVLAKWNNWTTFLDAMAQISVFLKEIDQLYVPVEIQQLLIDPQVHAEALKSNQELLPIYYDENSKSFSAPGVELKITLTNVKKRSEKKPLLEVYKFVPFDTELSLEDSVLVNIQLVMENSDNALDVIEIVDSFSDESAQLLCSVIEENSQIRNLSVYSTKAFESLNVTVQDKTVDQLPSELSLVILSRGSQRPEVIVQILRRSNCFVLSREFGDYDKFDDAQVISVHRIHFESLVLLRKTSSMTKRTIEIKSDLVWLEQLQPVLAKNEKVLLVAQGSDSGVLGLMTCLKKEVGRNVTCVFLSGTHRKFDAEDEFYSKQHGKGLLVNVWKDDVWGSYRHLPLREQKKNCVHGIALTNGRDLSDVQYVQGPITKDSCKLEEVLVHVCYAGVNFKDVVTATGRINLSDCKIYRSKFESVGFEFAGLDSRGQRLMGMARNNAFSNFISASNSLTCAIPDEWSVEDAATVPIAYLTVLYGLIKICRLKRGQSILIHLGTGGIGLSAINIALHYNCQVFTTVGSVKKREYLKNLFPTIPDSRIGNSRDCTFEQMILKQTRGRGVDIVINSLAEDQLLASTRCLARKGIFLELGRYDQQLNNSFALGVFGKGCAYVAFYLDMLFHKDSNAHKEAIVLLANGIKEGYVKPLPRVVYEKDKVQEALHYMSLGHHTGKIVLKFRDERVISEKPIKAKPRFFCDANKAYVLIGGLGGFGLELADWLIGRGAQKLVLVSRSGATSGYQQFKLRSWAKLGCKVLVAQDDLTTEEGCVGLLRKANALGAVDGVFNLSVVLHDALIENQSKETFETALKPKAVITRNMDAVTRQLCPYLSQFVVFSSVSCGRGNLGQTNYAMANSIMERICEQRKEDGYPALAIQWGLIGDVGLIVEKPPNTVIDDLTQQSISSCLDVMDTFQTQEEVIVSSRVCQAPKANKISESEKFLNMIADILAISSIKHVSVHSTLSKLGMDSASSVQLKQFLSSEHSVFYSSRELRNITLYMLMDKAKKMVN